MAFRSLCSAPMCAMLFVVVLNCCTSPFVEAVQGSCHGFSVKSRKSSCEMITLPQDFCVDCRIGNYTQDGRGDYLDCTRTYNLEAEDGVCLAAVEKYVAMNECDGARRNALNRFNKTKDEFARKVVDYFIYSVCENTCDCIPQAGNAVRDVPSMDLHRGNCQAHTQIDVCRVLPDIKLVRLEGTVDDSATLPPACPFLDAWFNSPAAQRWGSNPNTSVDNNTSYFLTRLMEAGQLLDSLQVYQECYDLELNQTKIDPPLLLPPFPESAFFNPVVHINAGSSQKMTASDGVTVWEADKFFSGDSATNAKPDAILNTEEDFVYQKERWGKNFTYGIPCGNGAHRVVLHYAEIFGDTQGPGLRQFDVNVEDQVIFKDVDIFAEVGGFHPFTQTADVTVTDGRLTITFTQGSANFAKLSGISVYSVSLSPDIVVTSLTLVDATADEDLFVLNNGMTLRLSDQSTMEFSVRANVQGVGIGSVVFTGNKVSQTVENNPPYALAGDDRRGDYNPFTLPLGEFRLTAIPYSERWGEGTAGVGLTVTITVVEF